MLEPWRIILGTLVLAFIIWWIASVVEELVECVEATIEEDKENNEMRTETIEIYEASDYEELCDMSVEDVIKGLDDIDDGYIGSSNYNGRDDYEGDYWDYANYKYHKVLLTAINMLKGVE